MNMSIIDQPKTGFWSAFFPGESTWHPLYKHSYLEIADALGSTVEQVNNESRRNAISKIVKDSYIVKSRRNLIIASIIVIIIFIIIAYISFKSKTLSKFNMILIAFMLVAITGLAIDYKIFAKGRGEAYWKSFNDSFQPSNNDDLAALKKQYRTVDENEKNREVMRESYNRNLRYNRPQQRVNLGNIAEAVFTSL